MNRFLPLAFVALLALGGCQTGTIGQIITGSVTNPVTPRAALQLHAAFYGTVAVGIANYNELGRCTKKAPPCSRQSIVNQSRKYGNAAEAALSKLDQWAVGNKNLNGPALYAAAKIAMDTAVSFNLANGVK